MSLPKHLRPRWRYLAVEFGLPETEASAGTDAIDRRALQRAVWFAARDLVGDVGSADLDLRVVRLRVHDAAGTADEGRATAVVRTHRGRRERARAVIACVDAVEGVPVRPAVVGVSGTVRACWRQLE